MYKNTDLRVKSARKKIFGRNTFRAFRNKLLDGVASETNIGTIIGDSVKNSVGTIMAIGGFIMLFSVIISLLAETGVIGGISGMLSQMLSPIGIDKNTISGVLSGLFEITTGSNLVSKASAVPAILRLPAASFIIGWAGLSVHFQVLSIAAKTDISIRPYLVGKLLQGILSAFYTWICFRFFQFEWIVKEPVLGNNMLSAVNWLKIMGSSLLTLSVILAVFAFLAIVGRYKTVATTRMKIRR